MISIITALYQSEKYLPGYREQMTSFAAALERAGVKFELVVIPTQPSEAEQYELDFLKGYPWVKVYPLERRGLYAAWNEGISRSSGDVIGFWNADDVRFPEAIIDGEKKIAAGAEFVYFSFYIYRYFSFFGKSVLLGRKSVDRTMPEFSKVEFTRSMNCGPFFLFTKQLYERVGPFDEQFKIAGDFDWCIRAAKITDAFAKSKIIGGKFRVDGTGLSSGSNLRLAAENNVIYRRHNVLEKLDAAAVPLEQGYDPGHISFGEEQIAYPV